MVCCERWADQSSKNERESGIVDRENSLMRHGRGWILGVLRLYLTPSSFGVAQDDRERHKRAIPRPNRIATSFFLLVGEAEESAPQVFRATIFYFSFAAAEQILTCASNSS
jgi:hypothetical protein